ncbi:hypothetical protein [Micromonospora sagamiensis]|uniref:Uncharacterized protein n=1 Tax=Micromonospora sagamiensis TaxID=47875 RepID=A0A562WEZ3_9ACTN|nr:hypothetical protein [Micromonospora sagamiensis]TWJ28447.1 hypothetical protein JD81_01951 [Micromonospora sagamiensis]
MIRAEILGDFSEADRLRDLLREDDSDLEVLSCAFVAAVRRRFEGIGDLREVAGFVAKLGAVLGADVPRRETEALVRVVMGEGHLLDSVEAEAAGTAIWAVLLGVVKDLELSSTDVDSLILEAEWYAEMIDQLGALDVLRSTSSEVHPAWWRLPHSW